MAGYFILYDIENNIGVRCTKKDGVQTLKELNPKLKEVMEVSGWQLSCSKLGDTQDMNLQDYARFLKEQKTKLDTKNKSNEYFTGDKCWYTINCRNNLCIFHEMDPESGNFTLSDNSGLVYNDVNPEFVFKTSDKFGPDKNWYPGQELFHFKDGSIGAFERVVVKNILFECSGRIEYVSEWGEIRIDTINNFSNDRARGLNGM